MGGEIMATLIRVVIIGVCWFIGWVCLGTGIKLYKSFRYEPASVGFVTALLFLLIMAKTILLM
jgi:hypothetical protein